MFNDPRILSLNAAQLLYCLEQIKEEHKESTESARNRIEYMARFINSEGVDQVQKARQIEEDPASEEELEGFLQQQLGDLDEIRVIPTSPTGDTENTVPSSFTVDPAQYLPDEKQRT